MGKVGEAGLTPSLGTCGAWVPHGMALCLGTWASETGPLDLET